MVLLSSAEYAVALLSIRCSSAEYTIYLYYFLLTDVTSVETTVLHITTIYTIVVTGNILLQKYI